MDQNSLPCRGGRRWRPYRGHRCARISRGRALGADHAPRLAGDRRRRPGETPAKALAGCAADAPDPLMAAALARAAAMKLCPNAADAQKSSAFVVADLALASLLNWARPKPASMTRKPPSRMEFANKPPAYALRGDEKVATAITSTAQRNIHSVVVVDDDMKVRGIITERVLVRRLLAEKLDPDITALSRRFRRLHLARAFGVGEAEGNGDYNGLLS
jgi:CBS domain